MNIFSYFRKAGIDTVDASFTGRLMSGAAGTIQMFGSLRTTRCIPDVEQASDAVGRAWGWRRSCQKTLQICS